MRGLVYRIFSNRKSAIFAVALVLVLATSAIAVAKGGLFKILADTISNRNPESFSTTLKIFHKIGSTGVVSDMSPIGPGKIIEIDFPDHGYTVNATTDANSLVYFNNLRVAGSYFVRVKNCPSTSSPLSPDLALVPGQGLQNIAINANCGGTPPAPSPSPSQTARPSPSPSPSPLPLKVTGSVKFENSFATDVLVTVYDTTTNETVETTQSKSFGEFEGKNYKTDEIANSILDHLVLKFYKNGYSLPAGEIRLSNQEMVEATRVLEENGEFIQLKVVKDIYLMRNSNKDFILQGKVKDQAGNLLSGVSVKIIKTSNNSVISSATSQNTSAEEYNYRLQLVGIENLSGLKIEFSKEGSGLEATSFELTSEGAIQSRETVIVAGEPSERVVIKDVTLSPPRKFSAVGQIFYRDSSNQKVYIPGARIKILNHQGTELKNGISATGLFWPPDPYAKIANYALSDIVEPQPQQNYTMNVTFPANYSAPDGSQEVSFTFYRSQTFNNGRDLYYKEIELIKANDLQLEVLDEATNSPIEGASVRITDRGCTALGTLSGTTDSQGFVGFSDARTINYLARRGDFVACAINPVSTTTKSGYFTSVRESGSSQFGQRIKIYLKKITAGSDNVLVRVHQDSLSRNIFIPGAKVIARKASSPDVDFAHRYTDQSGEAKFSLPSGNYIFITNKIDFAANATSVQFASIRENDFYQIDLGLSRVQGSRVKTVYVLEETTQLPLTPSTVKIINLSNNESTILSTNSLGTASYSFDSGSAYKIIANYLLEHHEMDVPAGDSYSGYRFYFSANNEKIIDSVKINVRDSKTGLLIRDNVRVTYEPQQPGACSYFSVKPSSPGIFFLMADFEKLDPENNRNCHETSQFRSGQTIPISVEALGYADTTFYPIITTNQNHSTVELTLNVIPEHSIYNPIIFADGRGIYDPANIKLQKLQNDEWVTVKERPDEVWHGDIKRAAFRVNEKGNYRALSYLPGATNLAIYSEKEFFDRSNDITLTIDAANSLCRENETRLFKNYGNGLYFLFEDRARYEARPEYYNSLASRLTSVMSFSRRVSPLIVGFTRLGTYNAFSLGEIGDECYGVQNAHMILIGTEYSDVNAAYGMDDFTTLTHEFGHEVHSSLGNDFLAEWAEFYSAIMALPENERRAIFNLFLDATIESDVIGSGGHPWENENEMFASFFNAYYANHERLYGAINFWAENNSQAQNIVAYMWQIFSDYIGPVYGNDSAVFRPVRRNLLHVPYTIQEIGAGRWRMVNFANQSLQERGRMLEQIYISPLIGSTRAAAIAAITDLNNRINQILAGLGLLGDTGSVNVTILDHARNPRRGLLVKIGPKIGLTDETGSVKITAIPPGNKPVDSIRSLANGQQYSLAETSPTQVRVISRQTVNLRLRINQQATGNTE